MLVELAGAVGLDADAAREVLQSGRYADEVRAAEAMWQEAGIHSVPAIVINDRHLISGGQPPEVFERALRQIAEQEAEQMVPPRSLRWLRPARAPSHRCAM